METFAIFFVVICGTLVLISGLPPEFATPSVTVNVLENLVVGGVVTTVNAYDPDGDTITTTLVSMNPPDAEDLFYVAVSGEITTTKHLDYETQAEYVMVVRATTTSGEAAEQTLEIFVENVNEAPEFESALIGTTALNGAAGGETVTILQAIDPDWTTDIKYTITDGNEEGDFSINQISGVISVSVGSILNSTITSAYALTIEAADSGLPPRTGTTTLVIGVCNGSTSVTFEYVIVLLTLTFLYQFFV